MNQTISIPTWKYKYETGIPEVDFQHKYFLELIHHFNERIEKGLSKEMIQNYLQELALYARFHFKSEENMMLLYDYKEYRHHHELHQNILDILATRIAMVESGKYPIEDFVSFLVDWFVEHTTREDSKLSCCIPGKSERLFND